MKTPVPVMIILLLSININAQLISIPQQLAFPGRDYLYFSADRGTSWDRLDPKEIIADTTYITAAAINPEDPDHFVIGTSHQGLFGSLDGGKSWQDMDPTAALEDIYQGAGFYNEISGLLFSQDGDKLFVRTAFNGKTYLLEIENNDLRILEPAIETGENSLRGQAARLVSNEHRHLFESLIIKGNDWPREYPKPQGYANDNILPSDFARDESWLRRRNAASNKFGIYINAYQASTRLDELLSYAKEHGFNSVVVDFKDDWGLLRYPSTLDIVAEVGSVQPLFSADELIKKLHDADIYIIARLVVFKDRALYRYDNNRYALWDGRLQEPWGVYRRYEQEPSEEEPNPQPRIEQVEYWVDPYSEFVRNYNIQIARELEDIGVDEVQFDYIRFPSDGRSRDIVTRFLEDDNLDKNSQRVRILSTFLAEARAQLTIPIGTDVFGFNAWARVSYLGQDIEAISHYVDVISPMSYPSHYPRAFYKELTYLDRAQFIYEEGTHRARKITNDRVIIRQYVQAFLIGGELKFEEPTYFSYLNRQLNGTIQGGGSGFTLWNNSGRYYMVNKDEVPQYIQTATEKALN